MSAPKLYLDTETCGLYGMPVLLQYAVEDGPIVLVDLWKQPIGDTLRLIEWICEHTVVGFNLVFDWFQLVKLYTVFRLCPADWIPEQHIDEIALREAEGRDGPCIKPAGALDLMLHSRKGPYQSLMDRKPIRIRRVPTIVAYRLRDELERRIKIDELYFAGRPNPDAPKWAVHDRKTRKGDTCEVFKDVVLKFRPAGGLKYLAEHALKQKPRYHYKDVEPPKTWYPAELGFAPFATAVGDPEQGWLQRRNLPGVKKEDKENPTKFAWPAVIGKFIEHWATRTDARDYASDDIRYTRLLDQYFGYPAPNDDDSTLAIMVAAVRWHGFAIDVPAMETLRDRTLAIIAACPVNVNQHSVVRQRVTALLDPMEQLAVKIETSADKKTLERITKIPAIEAEEPCYCGSGCPRCNHTGVLQPGPHPAAVFAQQVLDTRMMLKEKELYDKLLVAGRFHASFVVVGTKSNRMSGTDRLNPQGIKRSKEVRKTFTLSWGNYVLSGGDFDAYEISLADARYGDPIMRADLMSTIKIHGLFGTQLWAPMTYEEVMASDGSAIKDFYSLAKSGVFALLYGGDDGTLVRNLGATPENALAACMWFVTRYPVVGEKRAQTERDFCSITQPGGRGTVMLWADPSEYSETFLGFRRYFTLENTIVKELFRLASNTPREWRELEGRIFRTDRLQTPAGATSSALYGACRSIQSANRRAAENNTIQSPGGQITKAVQRKIWDRQPAGVHEFVVAPLNVHDEIDVVCHPDVVDEVAEIVRTSVESFRPQVPLIGMTWNKRMLNWAEKKGGEDPVKISWKNHAPAGNADSQQAPQAA